MQKRKGFTLVELVIVIAVIAILAGVLIGTFASVINRANASAEVQKTKSEEIAQKAEDILKKIEDSNWYGWEDFETSIVAKITQELKNQSTGLTKQQVEKIINDALTTWQANHQAGNTDLTKEQVKAIVENAIGTLHYEGVTEAQVRAIVKASESSISAQLLTPATIKQIVNAANEKNLTAAQVASVVTDANNTSVNAIITALNTTAEGLATEVQVENLRNDIKALAVEAADDVVKAKAFNIRINKAGLNSTNAKTVYDVLVGINALDETNDLTSSAFLFDLDNLKFFVVDDEGKVFNNCGLTLVEGEALTDAYKYWTFANEKSATYSTYLTGTTSYGALTLDGVGVDVGEAFATSIKYTNSTTTPKSVVIRTNDGTFKTELTVDAENDTVSHYGYLAELVVEKIYTSSYHEYGKILGKVVINQGHIVVEDGAEVPQISVESATGAVKVTANNSTLVSVDAGSASQTSVVANSNAVYVTGLAQGKISGSQANNVELPTVVTNETELADAISNKAAYIQLGANFTVENGYVISEEMVVDFAGYTISSTLMKAAFITNNSTLTFVDTASNGGITSENNNIVINNGVMTINGGKFAGNRAYTITESVEEGRESRGVINNAVNGKMIINNIDLYVKADFGVLNCGNITINGGKYLSDSESGAFTDARYAYCVTSDAGEMVINGGTIYGVHGCIGPVGGKMVINDVIAEVKEGNGNSFRALYCAGEINNLEIIINGGYFKSLKYEAILVGNKNDGGAGKVAVATINGGTFIGKTNGPSVKVDGGSGTYGIGIMTITGGEFSSNVSEANGVKTCVQGTDGLWVVNE